MAPKTLELVDPEIWMASISKDYDNISEIHEIIEFFGSVSPIENEMPVNMKIDTSFDNYTIFSHTGKPIDSYDVNRLKKAGDMRGDKGVSNRGFALKFLLGKYQNKDKDFNDFDILDTSFFISRINQNITKDDKIYSQEDKYIMFQYTLDKGSGKYTAFVDTKIYDEFPESVKDKLNGEQETNIFIFVRKRYEISLDIKQQLRFLFTMTNWTLDYEGEEMLQLDKPGMFIDKEKYNQPYLHVEFELIKINNKYKGKIRVIDHDRLNTDINDVYYVNIESQLSNKELVQQTSSFEKFKYAGSSFDDKDVYYSSEMKIQNISKDKDIRSEYYGKQIDEAGFVLCKSGIMYQTKVPSQKRNNKFRQYLDGIRTDDKYTRGKGFKNGQNLQVIVFNEKDHKVIMDTPGYAHRSMFDIQKIKADTDIKLKGDGCWGVIPFIINAMMKEFLWEKEESKIVSEEPGMSNIIEDIVHNNDVSDSQERDESTEYGLSDVSDVSNQEAVNDDADVSTTTPQCTLEQQHNSTNRPKISNDLLHDLDRTQGLVNVCVLCNKEQLICHFESLHIKSVFNGGSSDYENLVRACKFCNIGYNQKTKKKGMGKRNLFPWLKKNYPKNYDNVINKFKEWEKDIVEYDGESE